MAGGYRFSDQPSWRAEYATNQCPPQQFYAETVKSSESGGHTVVFYVTQILRLTHVFYKKYPLYMSGYLGCFSLHGEGGDK